LIIGKVFLYCYCYYLDSNIETSVLNKFIHSNAIYNQVDNAPLQKKKIPKRHK